MTQSRLPAAALAVGYLLFAVAGALLATIEILLIPLRYGSTVIPLAPVLAVLGNITLAAVSRGLTDTAASALPPVLGWIVTVFVLGSTRPEGDVLLPAGMDSGVSYALLGLGILSALGAAVWATRPGPWRWGRRTDRRGPLSAEQPGSGSGGAR